jgi:hypothetical protein
MLPFIPLHRRRGPVTHVLAMRDIAGASVEVESVAVSVSGAQLPDPTVLMVSIMAFAVHGSARD